MTNDERAKLTRERPKVVSAATRLRLRAPDGKLRLSDGGEGD